MPSILINHVTSQNTQPSATDNAVYSYIARSAQDYYDELLEKENRFPVFYQLSELRTGLLSWYPFNANSQVLEIGAGFGALTGLLCERCAAVVATERSLFRAKAITERWQRMDNLTVYAGEWSEIAFGQTFDYIILTGILERVGGGAADVSIYARFLESVGKLLKPDGKILLSVENRLGLKYFCGVPEPHTNRPFDGINRYYRGTSGYSFTKKELEDIVSVAGMRCVKFYYPLPDYKLPQLIYTDEYLPEKNLKERLIPYSQRNDTLVACEKQLYDDVIDNGMFPAMANSYMVECGLSGSASDVLYVAVSTDRGAKKSFATCITGRGRVEKIPLHEEGQENARQLYLNIKDLQQHGIPVVEHTLCENNSLDMPYITWSTLSNYIKQMIHRDAKELELLVDRLYAYILQSSEEVSPESNRLLDNLVQSGYIGEETWQKYSQLDYGPVLEKAYMELIPLNCFYHPQSQEFLYFDQEFVRENYPAKYVLYRAIRYIYAFTVGAEQYYPRTKMLERYGLQDTWEVYELEERRFLDEVRNHKQYSQFYKWASIDWNRIAENAGRLESEEERIAGYKVSDKMKKVWKTELAMLDEVDRICQKYQVKYFLVHGSLLGAVRHKGFIPWDDDLDVAMLREDYDRFLVVARTELSAPLSLQTPMDEEHMFWGGFSRIRNEETTAMEVRDLSHEGNHGIWIDILPLDVCVQDEKKLFRKMKKIRHVQRLLYAKVYGKDFSAYADVKPVQWKFYRMLAGCRSHEKLCKKLDAAMRCYTKEKTEELAFFSAYYKHRRLAAKDFEETAMLEFEGRNYPVPAGYENYLFVTLGKDYMKYPPEEERKPKHRGIFDPDCSYRQYKQLFSGMFDGCKGKKLIVFGAGMMFEDYMEKYGGKYGPDFLVDNDENKWGRFRMGIEIRKPEDILEVPQSKRHLIICSYYYKEISAQLETMGITDYKVYVQNPEWILKAEERNN